MSLIWVARDGDVIVFGAEDTSRKIVNLRRDPRATLMMEDDSAGRFGLRQHLIVHGTAEIVGPDIPDAYTELMDAQSYRYLGTGSPCPPEARGTASSDASTRSA